MIKVTESLLHWNYFLALESDLENLSRFIEFSENNFRTYSIELAHLLLASASEIDVVAKEICELLAPSEEAKNINEYRSIITRDLPELSREKVFVPRYGLVLDPWKNWHKKEPENPSWWQSYNQVKHERNDHFEEANLKNVLNSMGGLLVMVFYFYKLRLTQSDPNTFRLKSEVIRKLQPESSFIRLSENYYPSHILAENKF